MASGSFYKTVEPGYKLEIRWNSSHGAYGTSDLVLNYYLTTNGEYNIISSGKPITANVNNINYNSTTNKSVGDRYDDSPETEQVGSITVRGIPHNPDGTKTVALTCSIDIHENVITNAVSYVDVFATAYVGTITASSTITLDTIPGEAVVVSAPNFTDEENPTITYYNPSGNTIDTIEAAISLTGGVDDVPYRAIPKTGNTYTFVLTENERNILRKAAKDSPSISVRFYIKSNLNGLVRYSYITRTFTVVNANPIIVNPIVKNVISDVSNLTGNETVLVRHVSMAEYSFETYGVKGATIADQSVQCGSKKVSGMNVGVIDDVESGTFIFSATDNRGLTTTRTVEAPIVEYVKPTCNQKLTARVVNEVESEIDLVITGNYFNNTFGAVRNTLKVEVRFTDNNGVMSDWTELMVSPTFNGNTYTVDLTFNGFSYNRAYTFQCRVTDKLYTVESQSYTIRARAVFDWSEEDFNFNVPINVNGNIDMNGETILRHNPTANNVVLSSSGSNIYIRPGGTNDTSTEIRISSLGYMDVKGDLIVNGVNILEVLENAGLI